MSVSAKDPRLDTAWVDFELGTDVRDESRQQQDAEWAGAVADGRAHVSHREMAMLNAPQLCLAISDYLLVDELVTALSNRRSVLQKISSETLRHIVEYAFPGHGSLVTSSVIRRKIAEALPVEPATAPAPAPTSAPPFAPAPETCGTTTSPGAEAGAAAGAQVGVETGAGAGACAGAKALGGSSPFRICVRKRPMMPWEHAFGAYDVCSVDTHAGLTLHEGRLARNGRQLSMTHHQFVVDRVFDESASNK
jgi:hypothetical protein